MIQLQRVFDRICNFQQNLVVASVVRAVAVEPEPSYGIRKHRQIEPRQLAHLLPVVLRIEQPVLGLKIPRARLHHRNVDDIEDSWIATVLVLALLTPIPPDVRDC